MNLRLQGMFWGTLLAAGLSISACSKSQPPEQKPAAQEQPAPQASKPVEPTGEAAEHGDSGAAVVPGTTPAQIWLQIGAEQAKLAGVIQSGDLEKVHHLAFGIRDLTVALSDKMSGLSTADAARLQQTIAAIKKSASELDEKGDSGNLGGVKAEQARFDEELRGLQALTSSR